MSGDSEKFAAYDFATRTVQGYAAEENALGKRHKVDDGIAVPIILPVVHVNGVPGVSRNTLSEVERDYRQYRKMTDDDSGELADVFADVVDEFGEVITLGAP